MSLKNNKRQNNDSLAINVEDFSFSSRAVDSIFFPLFSSLI